MRLIMPEKDKPSVEDEFIIARNETASLFDESDASLVRDQVSHSVGKVDRKLPPNHLYKSLIHRDIHSIVTTWNLVPEIDAAKEILCDGKSEYEVQQEKEAIRYLLAAFKSIPFKKWAFFPQAMKTEAPVIREGRVVKKGATNCSGATFVMGHILRDDLDIPVLHANPYGHAALIATLADGRDYYVDPRNDHFCRIKLDEPLEESDGFTVFKVNKLGLDHKLVAVSDFEAGAVATLLENTTELKAQSVFDEEARQMKRDYEMYLDFDQAEVFMEGHFLRTRETDIRWQREKERIERLRRRQDIPVIGRLF